MRMAVEIGKSSSTLTASTSTPVCSKCSLAASTMALPPPNQWHGVEFSPSSTDSTRNAGSNCSSWVQQRSDALARWIRAACTKSKNHSQLIRGNVVRVPAPAKRPPAAAAAAAAATGTETTPSSATRTLRPPTHTGAGADADDSVGFSLIKDRGRRDFLAALKAMLSNFQRRRYNRGSVLTVASVPSFGASTGKDKDVDPLNFDPMEEGMTWSVGVERSFLQDKPLGKALVKAVVKPKRRRRADSSDYNHAETMRRYDEDVGRAGARRQWKLARGARGDITVIVPRSTSAAPHARVQQGGTHPRPYDPHGQALLPEQVASLDPGVRHCLSGVDGCGAVLDADLHEAAVAKRLLGLDHERQRLRSRRAYREKQAQEAKTPGERKKHETAAARCREHERCVTRKLRVVRRAFHSRVVGYLVKNFRMVLLPKFGASMMVRRRKPSGARRVISKATTSALLNWSHAELRQRLVSAAAVPGVDCKVVICDEPWTSKTCHSCGHINATLGGAHRFACPSDECNVELDRDTNGALNIFLRYLTLASFACETQMDSGAGAAPARDAPQAAVPP